MSAGDPYIKAYQVRRLGLESLMYGIYAGLAKIGLESLYIWGYLDSIKKFTSCHHGFKC